MFDFVNIYMYVGLNITEVAHDIQAQVSNYVTKTLGVVNSYDTWHGTNSQHMLLPFVKMSNPVHRDKERGQRDEDLYWSSEGQRNDLVSPTSRQT